jgi:hypothetical protein
VLTSSQFLKFFLIPLTLLLASCYPDKTCESAWSSTDSPSLPEGFGVNIGFTEPRPREMKMISEAGLRWVRMDFKWDETEKTPGEYDFSAYDRLLAASQPFGIRILFILDYGNPLYDNGAPPRTDAARQAFARWAVAAANHFKDRGILWELYNEPNHSLFWPPKPNVDEYIALAQVVSRSFHESVPQEKLIGPATSEIDFDFVEACFKAGLLNYWSAVSIHPYRRSDPESAAEDYCRLREMIQMYAPPGKAIPIISSEWGYSDVWRSLNEEKQAQMLTRAWLTNVGNGISLSIWYDWRDDGTDPAEPEHHFGLVQHAYQETADSAYQPKPAYVAAKTLTTFLAGCRFEKREVLSADSDYLLVFRKNNEVRLAAWTTSRPHNVLLPLTNKQYDIIDSFGANQRTISATLKGLEINLTNSPSYIVSR